MNTFFTKDYSGGAFVLFGQSHLWVLVVVVCCCLGILLFRKYLKPSFYPTIRVCLLVIILLSEISWHIWQVSINNWTIQGMLPLWLCSLTVWTMPLLLVFRSQTYFEWVFYMGLIGASQAILTPDLTIYGFPHFRFIEFFCVHGAIIIAIFYMACVEGFRPHLDHLPWVILVTDLYWLFCGFINPLVGGNYLYTQGKLPTPSLLDYLGPWPWYLVSMEIIGIFFCFLLYLPYALMDLKNSHRRIQPNSNLH